MCVPNFNEICEQGVFELSRTQVKTYSGSMMDVKPVYPRLSLGGYNHCALDSPQYDLYNVLKATSNQTQSTTVLHIYTGCA